ncbi:MAG: galactitol-1-phosphate 5-dehydrogenase [Halanaerobiaceae bacterium]
MKACVFYDIGDIRYEDIKKPDIKSNEVLVNVRASGICGSDILRVYKNGTYYYPSIPGHEFSGVVVEKGKEVKKLEKGDRGAVIPLIPCGSCAFCKRGNYAQCNNYDYLGSRSNGGFAEYVAVPESNFLKIPENVTFKEAALVEPAAVALHALRRAEVDIGDVIAVLGAGPIGIILGKLASLRGTKKIMLTDIIQDKLDYAEKMGFTHIFNSGKGDPVEWVKNNTERNGADVVIEAAGVPETFAQSILMVRKNGRITIMGNPEKDVLLSQNTVSQILRKEINLKGTWNSRFSEYPCHEWKVIIDLLEDGKLDLKSLITHEVSFSEVNNVLEMMRDNTEFYNKVMFINE